MAVTATDTRFLWTSQVVEMVACFDTFLACTAIILVLDKI